jgi:hypothetical protein
VPRGGDGGDRPCGGEPHHGSSEAESRGHAVVAGSGGKSRESNGNSKKATTVHAAAVASTG